MPIYEYRCEPVRARARGAAEALRSRADELSRLPTQDALVKQVSAAGFQFERQRLVRHRLQEQRQQAGREDRRRRGPEAAREAPTKSEAKPKPTSEAKTESKPKSKTEVGARKSDDARRAGRAAPARTARRARVTPPRPRSMKRYLIAGLLVWVPLGITLWVLNALVSALDQIAAARSRRALRPDKLLGLSHPGLRSPAVRS